mgnify:CR=1 FL=1|jgi:hypothetical protein
MSSAIRITLNTDPKQDIAKTRIEVGKHLHELADRLQKGEYIGRFMLGEGENTLSGDVDEL